MTNTLTLQPIGVVHSPFNATHDVPLQGSRATLEVFSEFEDGLDGLESSSHLVVMGFCHLADRSALRTRPSKVDPSAPAKGVFATRSPARPNPVSLTVVPLLRKTGLQLEVDHLDLVDGTPLVDLKAYSPGRDSVFCAQHKHRAPPMSLDDRRLAACLERDLVNFMGPAAHGPGARWGLAATFVGTRALRVDPREPSMRVQMNRRDTTTEAVMALTGAACFNQRLVVVHDDARLQVSFTYGPRIVELHAEHGEVPGDCAGWASAFSVLLSGPSKAT